MSGGSVGAIRSWLRSEEAFALRAEFRDAGGPRLPDPLALAASLRRRLPVDRARALGPQIELEARAAAKFDTPERYLYEREALEQASSSAISRFHAAAVPSGARVVDLGCGLGADSLAFAATGTRVAAIDRDPERAFLAAHNLGVDGGGLAVVGDAAALPARGDVLFVDPDRRPGGRRVATLTESSPALDVVLARATDFALLLVKAPPALPDAEIPRGASVEILSEGGVAKEALLRLGEGVVAGARAAVRLPSGSRFPVEPGPPAPVAAPEAGEFLIDPDPALRRAGGTDALAARLGAARVAFRSTYLTAPVASPTEWARIYPVLDTFAWRPRDFARRLAADPPRELIVKQRDAAVSEAAVRRAAPSRPDGPIRIVVLWSDGKAKRAALCGPPVASTDPAR